LLIESGAPTVVALPAAALASPPRSLGFSCANSAPEIVLAAATNTASPANRPREKKAIIHLGFWSETEYKLARQQVFDSGDQKQN
jgi:hypothetical protein